MKYLKAFWSTAAALVAFVRGSITEDEARALIGQPPVRRL